MSDEDNEIYRHKDAYIRTSLLAADRMANAARNDIRYRGCGSVHWVCRALLSALFFSSPFLAIRFCEKHLHFMGAKSVVLSCFTFYRANADMARDFRPCRYLIYDPSDGA
ncbi:hypothetical protein PcaKH16_02590 [Parageobacillus caldoxylosilyticus]|nr:hypothetical protein PcaKH16_02590 [Parageobacillus caldoxylosilyticus]